MLAGVPSPPRSVTSTSKENVQPLALGKTTGGTKVNLTTNGLLLSTTGNVGQLAVCRLPLNWIGGGGPAVSPGSTVQTPPATLRQDGKKSMTVNVWRSGAPPFALGKLVIVKLIFTVWPTTRLRLSPFGNPITSEELQTVCANAEPLNAPPTSREIAAMGKRHSLRISLPSWASSPCVSTPRVPWPRFAASRTTGAATAGPARSHRRGPRHALPCHVHRMVHGEFTGGAARR